MLTQTWLPGSGGLPRCARRTLLSRALEANRDDLFTFQVPCQIVSYVLEYELDDVTRS